MIQIGENLKFRKIEIRIEFSDTKIRKRKQNMRIPRGTKKDDEYILTVISVKDLSRFNNYTPEFE